MSTGTQVSANVGIENSLAAADLSPMIIAAGGSMWRSGGLRRVRPEDDRKESCICRQGLAPAIIEVAGSLAGRAAAAAPAPGGPRCRSAVRTRSRPTAEEDRGEVGGVAEAAGPGVGQGAEAAGGGLGRAEQPQHNARAGG